MPRHHDPMAVPARSDALSRRGAFTRGGGLALAALAGTHGVPAAAQESTEGELAISGEFVGAIPGASGDHAEERFVAVVADPPLPGVPQRAVRAYLCDGNGLDEWFEGEVAGDQLTLSSEGDATLEAELGADGATGTVTLADGSTHDFAAMRPTGRGGLYALYIREDLSAFGASAGGNALFLSILDEQATSRFLLPAGTLEEATAPVLAYPAEGEGEVAARLIALDAPENHLRGTTRPRDGKKVSIRVCEV